MKLLFVDCCISQRGEGSRTKTLADAFLAALRKAHRITQAQLAEYLSVQPQTISRWEAEGGIPDVTLLPQIALFFGITLDELFGMTTMEQIDRLAQQYPQSQWTFIRGSIADKALIDRIFREYQPDTVVNLAAQAGVRYSITNPDVYIEANIIGFYNILEACRNHPVEHLVYASSSSVYGSNKKVPYATEDKVDNPVSLYAATKKSNELLAHSYSKLYNITIKNII